MNLMQSLWHDGGIIIFLLMFTSAISWYWILLLHLNLQRSENLLQKILPEGHLSGVRKIENEMGELTAAVRVETAFLKSLAQIALFLGLLGTIVGILNSMQAIDGSGSINELFSQGIARALFTTGAGICAALPAVFAVPAFRRRCDKINSVCQSAVEVN